MNYPRASLIAFVLVACGGQTGLLDEGSTPPGTTPPPPSTSPSAPAPSCGDGQSASFLDPSGWTRAGSNPRGYEMQADAALAHCEKPGLHIRSGKAAQVGSFGTFMDNVSAAAYRDRRVRLRASMKAAGVDGWAGLWLRIDGADRKTLGFDNMQDRPLSRTRDFAGESIVLDVPSGALELAFGVLVSGRGEVWAKEIALEIVGADVPTTKK